MIAGTMALMWRHCIVQVFFSTDVDQFASGQFKCPDMFCQNCIRNRNHFMNNI